MPSVQPIILRFTEKTVERCVALNSMVRLRRWGILFATLRPNSGAWIDHKAKSAQRDYREVFFGTSACRFRFRFSLYRQNADGRERVLLSDEMTIGNFFQQQLQEYVRTLFDHTKSPDAYFPVNSVERVPFDASQISLHRPRARESLFGNLYIDSGRVELFLVGSTLFGVDPGINIAHLTDKARRLHIVEIADGDDTIEIAISKEVFRDGAWVQVF